MGTSDITGSVCIDDVTEDGVCSTGGESLQAGTEVYLYAGDGTFLGSTLTDSSGLYMFSDLPDGSYSIAIATTLELRKRSVF